MTIIAQMLLIGGEGTMVPGSVANGREDHLTCIQEEHGRVEHFTSPLK